MTDASRTAYFLINQLVSLCLGKKVEFKRISSVCGQRISLHPSFDDSSDSSQASEFITKKT